MVRLAPPTLQVLGPEHPVLVVGQIGNRRPHLRRPVRIIGIEPVEMLAPRHLHRQIGWVIRPRIGHRIQPAVPRAPVAQRRVPVDANIIEVIIGPQRVQMEPHVARPIIRPVSGILRPIRRIGQAHRRPNDRPTLRQQIPEGRNGRIAISDVPTGRQPPHLRPDQQAIGPRLRRQSCIVPRQPPQAPSVCRAKQRLDIGHRRRRIVRHDPPAPGIGGLLRPAIRIGKAVARRYVQEDERIQRHLQTPRLQLRHRLPHAVVRWCPTIGWRTPHCAHQMCRSPIQSGHRPVQRHGRLVASLYPRPDSAVPGPEIIAEPSDHQTDPLQVRTGRRQLIQRHDQIRPSLGRAHILDVGPGQARAPHHRLGGQHKLPRSGDQANPLQPVLQRSCPTRRPPKNLERQLRHAIAERRQQQVLEHHIGCPAIGWRRTSALDRLDQRIGHLVFGPAMDAQGRARPVQRLPVGPDPTDPVDRPFADCDGKAQGIGIGLRARPALAATLLMPLLQKPCRPDDLTRHPCPAQHQRHRRAFSRRLQPDRLQPRPHLSRGPQTGHQLLVQHPAHRPANRLPDASAQRLTQSSQYGLRHAVSSHFRFRPRAR